MRTRRAIASVAAVILVGHGFVHLLGTVAYLELGEISSLPYKTTILGGYLDLGAVGIRVFGAFWAVAAVGFVASAIALVTNWRRWRTLIVFVTCFSLALTLLDWTVASAGVASTWASCSRSRSIGERSVRERCVHRPGERAGAVSFTRSLDEYQSVSRPLSSRSRRIVR